MIRITHDYFEQQAVDITIDEMPLYGIERLLNMHDGTIPTDGPEVNFRLYDDDGELMASGVLTNDDECENQSAALRYGESMWGCTRIEVQLDGKWVQEIG